MGMKVLIAADMEGVTGVVHWDHVDASHNEYARFRKLMTADVNAAVRGAFSGGAAAVIVADGHGSARNIIIEELDPRVCLHSGSPSPLAMVQGIGADVSAAMFVGYHARAGSPNAILDHTWSSSCVASVWLNDLPVGEIGINAAVCGHFGVPVILVTGDQTACAEAAELLGPVETAVVKWANGRMAAQCLSPEISGQRIQDAAQQAVIRFQRGEAPNPLQVETPVRIAIELVSSEMADRVAVLPSAERVQGKRVAFHVADAVTAYRTMRAAVALARG
jgi:D-amino peptidase